MMSNETNPERNPNRDSTPAEWWNGVKNDWRTSLDQIKEFFLTWFFTGIVAIIFGHYFIGQILGMPDMSAFFIIATTILWMKVIENYSDNHKPSPYKSNNFFKSKNEDVPYPFAKIIIILLVIAFILYNLKGCPDSQIITIEERL